jgi:hypothetical protein
MRTQRTWRRGLAAVAACLAAAACESETELTMAMDDVSSVPDQFSWSVSGLENTTGGVQYFWTVTNEQAVIDVTQAISSGSAIIQIRDGAGTVVYEESANDAVDDTTDISAPGLWQVSVVVTKLTGGFSFTGVTLDTLAVP